MADELEAAEDEILAANDTDVVRGPRRGPPVLENGVLRRPLDTCHSGWTTVVIDRGIE